MEVFKCYNISYGELESKDNWSLPERSACLVWPRGPVNFAMAAKYRSIPHFGLGIDVTADAGRDGDWLFQPLYDRFAHRARPGRCTRRPGLKALGGLGYYSRARNLHKAAKYVTNDLQGHWPESYDDLQSLPGVGPYTAAAIASIAFGQVVPAIDGNFFRVFSRLLKIDDDIAQPKSRKVFYQAIEPIVDPDRPGDFNQAIMDLGTTYMKTDNPDTVHSPVKKYNAAYRDGVEDQYPVKTKKKKPVRQLYQAQVTRDSQGRLLYEKRPDTGLLAGFWTFPLKAVQSIEDLQGEQLTVKPVVHIFLTVAGKSGWWQCRLKLERIWQRIRHGYRWTNRRLWPCQKYSINYWNSWERLTMFPNDKFKHIFFGQLKP